MSQRKYSNTIWYVGWLRSRKPDKEGNLCKDIRLKNFKINAH